MVGHSFGRSVLRFSSSGIKQLKAICPWAGPGIFDFTQGQTEGSLLWNIVAGIIKRPSREQVECHHPKPILLSTGEMSVPYAW